MRIGGSAGLRIIIALADLIPENSLIDSAVVWVYSSILSRVAMPADLEEMLETISTYSVSGCTLRISAMMGIVAWPPQVIILTLGMFKQESRLIKGTHILPILAGVMSMVKIPSFLKIGAFIL